MNSSAQAATKKVYSSMRIEPVYPDGVEYIYVFRNERDVEQARKYFKTQVPVMSTTFNNRIAPEFNRLGFADPSATWTPKNPDGSTIWSRKFS